MDTEAVLYLRPRLSATTDSSERYTAAVLRIKPRFIGTTTGYRSTGAVVYVSPRLASGPWSSSGVSPDSDRTNLRNWLPAARIPVGEVGGKPLFMSPVWYQFFSYLVNTTLGGMTAATIGEIVTAVEETQDQSALTASAVSALAQQTQANADALSATVQVVQTAALPGSENIPPVQSYF